MATSNVLDFKTVPFPRGEANSHRVSMPCDPDTELKFEIGHVLFIDVVGYSTLVINEQSELLRELNEIVRGTPQFRLADAAGALIRLPTGDGMALVFRNSPEAPAQCALEIGQALKAHPQIRLRMGIHSGPVNEVSDVNERANIAGAGINMAQRVMDCGDAGHILLSQHVAEDLEHYARWRPHLHKLGDYEVKHGLVISVVNLYRDELGNAELPEKFARARRPVLATPPLWRKRTLIISACLAASALTTGFWLFTHQKNPPPAVTIAPQVAQKSIAVLPFENLSANP